MLRFDINLSGSQVGRELAEDPEEAIYALEAMADRPDHLLDEIPQLIAGMTAENVTAFLRNLADAIENRD